MKKTIYLAFLGLLLTTIGCNKTEKVSCSDEFVTIKAGVVDATGKPVLGANVFTIRQSNGDTIRRGTTIPGTVEYAVLTDNEKSKVNPQGENFRFVVRKDNKFVTGIYRIKTNYCHLVYVSGPTSLTLK
ncbi:MAG: hypothetical protein V4616_02965 [Bacteroidota bacterium]